MKKFIAIIMAVVLSALSLSAFAASEPEKLNNKDFTITVGKNSVKLDDTIDKMTKALGKKYEAEVYPSCLYEGNDTDYSYDGITIFAVNEKKKQIIKQIAVNSKEYSTARGIKVGDNLDAVIAKYGKKYEKSGSTMTYYMTKTMRIIFTIKDGKVSQIDLNGIKQS